MGDDEHTVTLTCPSCAARIQQPAARFMETSSKCPNCGRSCEVDGPASGAAEGMLAEVEPILERHHSTRDRRWIRPWLLVILWLALALTGMKVIMAVLKAFSFDGHRLDDLMRH